MSKNTKDKQWPYSREVKKVAYVIGGLWAALLIISAGVWLFGDIEKLGTYGDTFGILNALFSGSAFVGLIYTILLQREELKAQREELRLTRNEMAGQRAALEKQNEAFIKQSFENTFFKLLEMYEDNIASARLALWGTKKPIEGEEAFVKLHEFIKTDFKIPEGFVLGGLPLPAEKTIIKDGFVYRTLKVRFSAYFKTIYKILSYVLESDINNKKFYISVLRAQISPHEMAIIFYSCLLFGKTGAFKDVIERTGFFENLDFSLLMMSDQWLLYSSGAYDGWAIDSTKAKKSE